MGFLKRMFSTTASTFRKCCDELVTPLLGRHGFILVHFDGKSGAFGLAIYRRGEQSVELHVSTHNYDYPGEAKVNLSVGQPWPSSQCRRVGLHTYVSKKALQNNREMMRGVYPFDDHTDVRATVKSMCRDLEECAIDFLSGDLKTFDSAAL